MDREVAKVFINVDRGFTRYIDVYKRQEYEREIIVERTRAGLQAAKERGKLTGRPIGLSEDEKRKAIAAKSLYEDRDYSIDEICRILHIGSKATLRCV